MKEVREWVRRRERRERDRSGWERPSVAMETGSYQLTPCFPLFPHPPPHSLPLLFPALPPETPCFSLLHASFTFVHPAPHLSLWRLLLFTSTTPSHLWLDSFPPTLLRFFLPVFTAAHVKPPEEETRRLNTTGLLRAQSELHVCAHHPTLPVNTSNTV